MTVKKDRIEAIIQKEVSSIIQMELKDPKLGFITITDVTVTNDLSIAKIYVTFLGKQERIDAGMKTLERSKGFIRSLLSKRMTIRKVPQLIFLYDESLEKGNKIEKIIKQINQQNLYKQIKDRTLKIVYPVFFLIRRGW